MSGHDAPQRAPSREPAAEVEFYVGYFPVPRRLARFVRVAVPLTLWIMVLAAIGLSRAHPDAGRGSWDDANLRLFNGVVRAAPYPVLFADDRGDGRPGVLLLVEVGKFGGGQRALPLDGKRVTLAGFLLERDGRRMLEMEPGDGAVRAIASNEGTIEPRTGVQAHGPVRLRGEIVDSKCFLGAMRPGGGKPHKECATLCIAGGIPPMLVTRDASGTPAYFVLTDATGEALGPDILPLVADPVEVVGELEEFGGLWRVRVTSPIVRL
jgi:hypothetical protein